MIIINIENLFDNLTQIQNGILMFALTSLSRNGLKKNENFPKYFRAQSIFASQFSHTNDPVKPFYFRDSQKKKIG